MCRLPYGQWALQKNKHADAADGRGVCREFRTFADGYAAFLDK